ncbi:hypothetical protein ACFE04_025202 [Oxalis oulophora]
MAASCFADGSMGAEYENSLFSSSLSDIFTQKLRMAAHNNSLYGHSFDNVASHYEEEGPFESLEEMEAQTIRNLLPNDEDLFSAVTSNGLHDPVVQSNSGDDELEFFNSIGGMDLGDDKRGNQECVRHVQHNSPPIIPTNRLPGANVHRRALSNGTAMDVQSAVQASFIDSARQYGITSNLPSLVKSESTGQLSSFHEFGHLQGHMNFNVQGSPTSQLHSLPQYHDGSISSFHGNPLGPIARNINHKRAEIFDNGPVYRLNPNGHSVKLNDQGVFGTTASLPGNHYASSNSYLARPPGMMWQNSPSFVNGVGTSHPNMKTHGLPRGPSFLPNAFAPININQHVESAPVVNHSLWERRRTYTGASPDASAFHQGSLGSMRLNAPLQSMEFMPHNIFQHNGMELLTPTKSPGLQAHHQRVMHPGKGQMIHMMNAIDSPHERVRSRRNEGCASPADKKLYELDIDHILRGEDSRTTLMIKNIPNKYTSKMLLGAIDEHHRGTYDFIYLPIDFKNKCNVGYAFINMIDPKFIVPFYKAFNGKKWEKFNSEKVASLAYARIQGKSALVSHFQNSSLMNEDKRCRPILFNTDGPNVGDQIPFPMGGNVRTRSGKARTINIQGENPRDNLINGEDHSSNGEASSKDSEEGI